MPRLYEEFEGQEHKSQSVRFAAILPPNRFWRHVREVQVAVVWITSLPMADVALHRFAFRVNTSLGDLFTDHFRSRRG